MSIAADSIVPLLIGSTLLLFGGRYYWWVAGGVGFLFGTNMGSAPDGGVITSSALAMGIIFGFIAAVAAVLVTKLALGLSGFIVGGIFTVRLLELIGWNLGSTMIAFVIGGVLGLLLVIASQDWALIFLSVLTGAGIVVNQLELDPATIGFVYIVLFLVGFGFQLFLKWRN
ncbi:MAG: hypothetical protein CSB13_11345 [Chloroflexi bacterium]|nr:MAG: hypothetical protein CSB13_11345 [Chloroflexota bacterium]